jgi:hypothetical protein
MIALGIALIVLALMHVNGMVRSVINTVKITTSPEGQRLLLSAEKKAQANVGKYLARTIVQTVLAGLFAIAVLSWAIIVVFRSA